MTTTVTLDRLLSETYAVLLDFDGPVCSVFAGFPATTVTHQLRQRLADFGAPMTDAVRAETDPLAVLQWTARLGHEAVRRIEDELRTAELVAVADAAPTPWSHEFIKLVRAAGRPLAIVSNNSEAAVRAYLEQHGLTRYVGAVVGRAYADPARMKPNPEPVLAALDLLHARQLPAVLIGDSVTDVEAARRAGVRSIGHANREGKRARLLAAGADAVAEEPDAMRQLIDALCNALPN
ncbi:MAG: HAD family hydrolase [Micromonosporaceae bacterium]